MISGERPGPAALVPGRASEVLGGFLLDGVTTGDSALLMPTLPDDSVDVAITSPPYWGQRLSDGIGVENDPREYLKVMTDLFASLLPKLKKDGLLWINIGDAYNTPVNWRTDDYTYSSLGPDKTGLSPTNSAYVKTRAKRRAFIDSSVPWLTYGNGLALPQRLIVSLCDAGYLFRGEIIWRKRNAMPEGRCRRPHRQHEPILLFARDERHRFRVSPPVKSVWDISNEKIDGKAHYSRFPLALPRMCLEASDVEASVEAGAGEVVVFDPFTGSGTTGLVAMEMGCRYIGAEIDPEQAAAAHARLQALKPGTGEQLRA